MVYSKLKHEVRERIIKEHPVAYTASKSPGPKKLP
jgi:hypothetical protein